MQRWYSFTRKQLNMWRFLVFLFSISFLFGCSGDTGIGAQHLGAKYIASPLGEGYGYDSDPLIRNDAFDCTTFVETVLADDDVDKLNKIRYRDCIPNFLSRNHFIESDWINNNSNLVENVSGQYGKTQFRDVIIDKRKWFKRVHNIDTNDSPKTVHLEYLPYSAFTNIDNKSDLIILFIVGKSEKNDTIGTDLAVVHMGFLLAGGKTLRHASSSKKSVVDVDFSEYIAHRTKSTRNIGIVLLGIKK